MSDDELEFALDHMRLYASMAGDELERQTWRGVWIGSLFGAFVGAVGMALLLRVLR